MQIIGFTTDMLYCQIILEHYRPQIQSLTNTHSSSFPTISHPFCQPTHPPTHALRLAGKLHGRPLCWLLGGQGSFHEAMTVGAGEAEGRHLGTEHRCALSALGGWRM